MLERVKAPKSCRCCRTSPLRFGPSATAQLAPVAAAASLTIMAATNEGQIGLDGVDPDGETQARITKLADVSSLVARAQLPSASSPPARAWRALAPRGCGHWLAMSSAHLPHAARRPPLQTSIKYTHWAMSLAGALVLRGLRQSRQT